MMSPTALNKRSLEQITSILKKIDKPAFWGQLKELIALYLRFDFASAFSYYKDYQPSRLVDLTPSAARDRLHFTLLSAAYLIGPYYNKLISTHVDNGFYALGDIAPDALKESEYYRVYYSEKNVGDEGMFLVRLEPEKYVSFLIERKTSAAEFSLREREELNMLAPLVCTLIQQHYHSNSQEHEDESERFDEYFSKAFNKFGSEILTPREKNIAHLILRGHSSKSGARELDISPNTERVHRRRLYEKLGITSQAELFWMFIESTSHYDGSSEQDPLAIYLQNRD